MATVQVLCARHRTSWKECRVANASEEQLNLTAGGHFLPSDWLARVVLVWSGYALSMFAGTASSYAGI